MKLTALLLTLVAGLVLGWYAHKHWDASPVGPVIIAMPPAALWTDTQIPTTASTPGSETQLDTIMQLLQRNAWLEAVERYESLQTLADSDVIQQARSAILLSAQQRVKARDFVAAEQLLQRFLLASYRDSEARLLLAEAFIGQQDYLTAIEQLYEARGVAFRSQMLERITQRIRQVAYEQARRYRENTDNTGLLVLYQNLTQREPDYATWFIELAVAQLALDDRDAAQYSLALVTSDPDVGEQARTLLAKLQQTTSVTAGADPVAPVADIAGIPIERRGQNFLVAVTPANAGSLQLLIDTGASMTVLTPAALQQRGMRYRDTGRSRVFNTANGTVRAPIYVLESLTVGNWTLEQLEVGVLELNGIDGLLGMNFLRHFRFFIDQNASMLRLSLN